MFHTGKHIVEHHQRNTGTDFLQIRFCRKFVETNEIGYSMVRLQEANRKLIHIKQANVEASICPKKLPPPEKP